jgi:hypothetical protein
MAYRYSSGHAIGGVTPSDPGVDIGRRWRIVVSLPNASKEDAPIGSRIWVAHDIKQALGVANS